MSYSIDVDPDFDDKVWEENPVFVGPCTCEHREDQHGWGSCNVDGCLCDAGWEE